MGPATTYTRVFSKWGFQVIKTMPNTRIKLQFADFSLSAELFDTRIANEFAEGLPYEIELTGWGSELYGSIGRSLGSENPVPDVPPGALAYTEHGDYLCIFFGQRPAWPVEHIGMISDDSWSLLKEKVLLKKVVVSR